jgi:hypothetical protein
MKLVDCTRQNAQEDSLDRALSSVKRMLGLGETDQQAQETVIARLQRSLDNRFTLMQNVTLDEFKLLVPLVLVGPPGVMMLNVSGKKGIYRAKEESWWEMNKTTRSFQPSRINLIKNSRQLGSAVDEYLTNQGVPHPSPVPIMVFTHPGVHVDTARPAVRLVLMDGIDRFVMGLLRGEEVLRAVEIKNIADSLAKTRKTKAELAAEEQELLAAEKPVEEKKTQTRPVPQLNLPPALARLRFSQRQWIMLALILLANLLVLGGFIFLILLTA